MFTLTSMSTPNGISTGTRHQYLTYGHIVGKTCMFIIMYSYFYVLFLHERTFIFISLGKAQLNNCFDWILWRYINKNYYYIRLLLLSNLTYGHIVGKTCMYTLTSMSTPNGISTGTRHQILLMDILWVRHVCILLLLCQLLMESQLAQDIQSYLWTYCG